jgi:hypothetical protein
MARWPAGRRQDRGSAAGVDGMAWVLFAVSLPSLSLCFPLAQFALAFPLNDILRVR